MMKGFFWIISGVTLQRLLEIATKIVLVRLLLPAEFGIIATAYIVINLLKVLNETGISTAIIRRQEADEESFSTAFFFNLAISFISLISVFFLAPLAAAYFKNSSLTPVIRVLSLVIFIESFFYVHNTLFLRDLNFKNKVIPDLVSAIIYSIFGITLVCLNFGLWSLVWSSLARSAAAAVLYWKLNPWRPKARFSYAKLRPLLGIGLKISAVKIIRYARNNVDYLVIAKFLGPVALGYYYVAYEVAHYCDAQLSPLLSKVIFSAFGKLKQDEKLRRYYFKAVQYVAILGVFVSFSIFALSKWIVLFLYGPKWLPSVIPMQFLSFLGGIKLLENSVFNSLFVSKGNMVKFIKINAAIFLISAISVFTGVTRGVAGVAALFSCAGLLGSLMIIFSMRSIINHGWREYAKSLLPAVSSGLVILALLWLPGILPYAGAAFLLLAAASALIIYVIMLKMWGIDIFEKIRSIRKLIIS